MVSGVEHNKGLGLTNILQLTTSARLLEMDGGEEELRWTCYQIYMINRDRNPGSAAEQGLPARIWRPAKC